MNVRGKKVFVGLSGGVDSSVSAALLKEAGAEVTGVFIKGWYPPGMPCTWAAERRDAMRVAASLHIPFVTLDASEEYKKGVIDYLLREYALGKTPNPDVMCNREVKFGAFYEFARTHGADYVATGHYAKCKEANLYRGRDLDKDQSYFLWAVPKEALTRTLFPVGHLRKEDVRKEAERRSLPVAQKKDSQGICFLGSISVEEFLLKELGSDEGQAVNEGGEAVGVHNGSTLHTLGERIALKDAAPGPWYVVKKDLDKNILTVSKERLTDSFKDTILLCDTNWLTEVPDGTYEAQYRYHGPVITGSFSAAENSFIPDANTEPLASGQSLVLYTKDLCHGGGIMR